MRKIIIWCSILTVLCIICTGCAKKKQNIEANKAVYWTVSEMKKQFMEEQVKSWNEKYPEKMLDLEIKVIAKDLIDEKLWSALHGGILQLDNSVPDLVDIEYHNMEKYVAPYNCMLYPVNNIISEYEKKCGANKAFDGYTYRNICFGIPEGSGRMIVIYNRDALNANYIDYETIESMQEFESAAKLYYERTGNYFCSIDMRHYYLFLSLFLQNQKECSEVEMAYQNTLDQIESLYHENVFCMMEGGRSDSRSFAEAFKKGEIASVFIPATVVEEFVQEIDDTPYIIGEIPGETVTIPGYATAITSVSENYFLMQEFLKFAKVEGNLSTNEEFSADKDLKTYNTERINQYLEVYELDLAERLLRE